MLTSMVLYIPAQERFSGCLIGQCLGDALGFPVEGRSSDDCGRYVRDRLHAADGVRIAGSDASIGQYTDDSQLARELMQSYVEVGHFDPDRYAGRIAAIFREEPVDPCRYRAARCGKRQCHARRADRTDLLG